MSDPIQLISVTSALSVIDKSDALCGWTAYRIADGVLDVARRALIVFDETLREVKAQAVEDGRLEAGQPATRKMRDEAQAEAWRSLSFVRTYAEDPRRARNDIAGLRRETDIDLDTHHQYEFSATKLGNAVHDALDSWLLTGHRPGCHPEMMAMMDQAERWLDAEQPEPILAEATGLNFEHGYAGRTDLVAIVNYLDRGRVPCEIDWKTSRKSYTGFGRDEGPTTPYPEAGLQLSAYSRFEKVIRWDHSNRLEKQGQRGRYYYVEDEDLAWAQPMPAVEGGLVVHITPEHCNAHPVVLDEWLWETWLYTLENARRVNSPTYNRIIGPAQAPAGRPNLRVPDDPQLRLVTDTDAPEVSAD